MEGSGVVTLRLQGRLKFYAPKTMPTTTALAAATPQINIALPTAVE